jgi:hypothetical protein
MLDRMPWKPAVASQLEREVDKLKTTIVCLRRELTNKAGYAAKLAGFCCCR